MRLGQEVETSDRLKAPGFFHCDGCGHKKTKSFMSLSPADELGEESSHQSVSGSGAGH